MKYTKPDFIVEEFLPNVAVAACNREWSGQVEAKWEKQSISCSRNEGTADWLFASGTEGCQFQPCHMVFIPEAGTYTQAQLKSKGLADLNVDSRFGEDIIIPEGGGYVLCWDGGNHYGVATPAIVKVMTSSF